MVGGNVLVRTGFAAAVLNAQLLQQPPRQIPLAQRSLRLLLAGSWCAPTLVEVGMMHVTNGFANLANNAHSLRLPQVAAQMQLYPRQQQPHPRQHRESATQQSVAPCKAGGRLHVKIGTAVAAHNARTRQRQAPAPSRPAETQT